MLIARAFGIPFDFPDLFGVLCPSDSRLTWVKLDIRLIAADCQRALTPLSPGSITVYRCPFGHHGSRCHPLKRHENTSKCITHPVHKDKQESESENEGDYPSQCDL